MSLHLICLKQCTDVQPPPYSGPCACRYDPANPVDIQVRVASGTCPAGRFDDPVARYNLRPLMGNAAELAGLVPDTPCGCAGGTVAVDRVK